MKPIGVIHSSEVNSQELSQALMGLAAFYEELGYSKEKYVFCAGTGISESESEPLIDKYERGALVNDNGIIKVLSSAILSGLYDDRHKFLMDGQEIFLFAITAKWLTDFMGADNYYNFLFGTAGGNYGVFSVDMIRRGVHDLELAGLCVRHIVQHEFGHMLGLPSYKREHATENSLGHHCANLCVMRQSESLGLAIKHSQELARSKRIICNDCLIDFVKNREAA